jgi:hypothetical protein
VRDHVAPPASGPQRPDGFVAPSGPVGRRDLEGPLRIPDTPATRREDVPFGADAPIGDDSRGPRPGMPDDTTSSDLVGIDQAPSPTPSSPQPDWPSPPRPALSWPPFAAEPPRGTSDAAASWPIWEPTPRVARSDPPMASPPSPPTVGRAPTAFPPLPTPSTVDRSTTESHRPDSWRVRAAAPDVWKVARLDLPPWPDLPDAMPEAMPEDDLAWRSIERRLERIARLEREQRRR